MMSGCSRTQNLALALALLAGAAAAACSRGGGSSVDGDAGTAGGAAAPSMMQSSHPPMMGGGSAAESEAVTWSVPSGWVEQTPSSQMRRAQYSLPGAGGAEAGECVVFYFGAGQGGDVQGNIARWASQFSTPDGGTPSPRTTEKTAGNVKMTRVDITGTYHPSAMTMGGGPAPAPQPGYAMFGLIIPGPDANWFVRCTGPEKTMQQHSAAFDSLIASVHIGG